jgi:hypothetical protein
VPHNPQAVLSCFQTQAYRRRRIKDEKLLWKITSNQDLKRQEYQTYDERVEVRRLGEIRTPHIGISFPRSQSQGSRPGERIEDQ